MTLSPGARPEPDEIQASLGAGGPGEICQAQDAPCVCAPGYGSGNRGGCPGGSFNRRARRFELKTRPNGAADGGEQSDEQG
jgi:hypothetical protein